MFSSKKSEEAAIDVGAEFIGMVKTNIKGLCKKNIENLTKDWPGGSYLMLRRKPMVPGLRPKFCIGYKYNTCKVLSFIVTENTGRTKAGLSYLYKHPGQFSNVATRPVARLFSCITSLNLLMRSTTTKNQGSLVWRWRISGLLSVVV